MWSKIKAKVAAGGGSGVLQSREVFLKEAGHSVIESYTVLKKCGLPSALTLTAADVTHSTFKTMAGKHVFPPTVS